MNEKELERLNELEQLFDKHSKIYYEKHFLGKDIYIAMSEEFKNMLFSLMSLYLCFGYLRKSLDTIKNSEDFYNNLPQDDKEFIDDYIQVVEFIIGKIYQILDSVEKVVIS